MLGEIQRSVAQRPFGVRPADFVLVMNVSPVAIDTHSYAMRPRKASDLQLESGATIFTTGAKFAQSGLKDVWSTGAIRVTKLDYNLVHTLLQRPEYSFILQQFFRGAGFMHRHHPVLTAFLTEYEKSFPVVGNVQASRVVVLPALEAQNNEKVTSHVERPQVDQTVQHGEGNEEQRVHPAAGGGAASEDGQPGDGVPVATGEPAAPAVAQQDGGQADQADGADVRADSAHEAAGGPDGSGENGGRGETQGNPESAVAVDERGGSADGGGSAAGGGGAGEENRGVDTGSDGAAGRTSDRPAEDIGPDTVVIEDPLDAAAEVKEKKSKKGKKKG